jgi:hypothetical protein
MAWVFAVAAIHSRKLLLKDGLRSRPQPVKLAARARSATS